MMTPIRLILPAVLLSLQRRYLERHIDRPFDVEVSRELDAVIVEQEALVESKIPATERGRRR